MGLGIAKMSGEGWQLVLIRHYPDSEPVFPQFATTNAVLGVLAVNVTVDPDA